MPDDNPDDTQQTDVDDAPDTGDDAASLRADRDKWKALARKHESAARQNAAAAKRLRELEDADKSEGERAAEAAREAQQRADKAERELLRLRVAHDKGLTPAQARRLQGDSEDELIADADELLRDFSASKGSPAGRKPSEALTPGTGGADPDQPPVELDPDKLAAAISAQH